METKDTYLKIQADIEVVLKQNKGITSPSDLAAKTGYALRDVNSALNRMLELYEAKAKMNSDTGALQFKFDYPLKRRDSRTFKEILFKISQVMWNVFKKIYRASFGVLLLLYTTIFLFILVGGKASGNNRNSSRSSSGSVSGILQVIFQIIRFIAIKSEVERISDPSGMRYRRPTREKNKGKGFIVSVFNFVLGPERVDYNPLNDAKEVIAFAKFVSSGRLTVADIILLSGVTYDEAESLLAEYAGKFNGDLQINENGYVVCVFNQINDELVKTVSKQNIICYFDEVEAPYEITGNSLGKNFGISVMNIFNLFMSMWMLSVLDYPIIGESDMVLIVFKIFLAWFPFLLSVSFFMIPIIRIPIVLVKEKQRKLNIIRKQVYYFIYKSCAAPFNYEDFKLYCKENKISSNNASEFLNSYIIDLKGELKLGDNGEKLYDFTMYYKQLSVK